MLINLATFTDISGTFRFFGVSFINFYQIIQYDVITLFSKPLYNKNKPLITINMVKMYPLEADTRLISIRKPYAVDIKTVSSIHGMLQYLFFVLFVNKKYPISQYFLDLSVFKSRIVSLYLTF